MKKKSLLVVSVVLACAPMLTASIVTNMNQSALYYRLLSRNASTDIDAVYYNPAGLTRLADGFYLALHNQTITQKKTVVDGFPWLNNDTYEGKVNVPIFPNVYAVYKKGPLAVSFGFGPNAGGGTADYANGLPSFEMPFSSIPALLTSKGIPTTAYSVDTAFKGSSIYYGFQLNGSYALNDMFSLAVGFRYILAKNKYEGYIRNVLINPTYAPASLTGQMIPAPLFFTNMSLLLASMGQLAQAAEMAAYAAMTADKTVEAEQVGSGFTPLLSVCAAPLPGLTLSAKYEFNTKLELENKTTKDDVGMFPDGEKNRNDIPAILSFGAAYTVMPKLRASLSYNLFFDKSAKWEDDRQDLVNKNTYDLGLGLEYDLAGFVTVSAGYLCTQMDLSDEYQTDTGHELSARTLGFGLRLKLIPRLNIDLGGIYVTYPKTTEELTGLTGPYTVEYKRSTWAVAIGFDYLIF